MNIFKKFIQYYKPYKLLFLADMTCALVVSSVDLVFPLILSYLTENFFKNDKKVILGSIFYIGIALIIMYVIRYFCEYFITSWGHIMGAKMEKDMRRDLFNHFQVLPFSYYDDNNTGKMMSKLIAGLYDIAELAHHGPEDVFISVIKIVGSFSILLLINIKLTFILFIITLIMIVFSVHQNKKMEKVFTSNMEKIESVNSSVQDSLSGIRIVKSFGNEDLEKKKFSRRNNEYLNSKVNSYIALGKFVSVNKFFEGLFYVAIIVFGSLFIIDGSLKSSELIIYVLYINIYINPIDILMSFIEEFQKGYAGFKRFIEVIKTTPELDKDSSSPLTDIKGDIEFKNVSFSYNDESNVFNNINMKINSGSNIALVGPSGTGKTTLCSLIPRFYDVTSGSISIDGKDIRDITLKSLRGAIGIVQQDIYMFDGTIIDNIGYGKPDADDKEIIAAAKKANIHEFIMSLDDGYKTFVGERGVKLSGGQKQRISIARVFLKNPSILILDEATSALDNESEKFIQNSLEELSKNRTTLVIAHRLSTIRNSDEIIVIKDGEISERGNHDKLLQMDGIYSYYYNMQFKDFNSVSSKKV
ncbi:ABC transporter ATP-binding protein [Clostridium beijerinckii]|uniref:ABC transporter ATP-binding protein n=1 Tax=Clostridium beijerinckii TaxID=1520 RepID=UPI00080A3C44|nr:ABC transporter ATP-binding protein [Clostridium beijerinckii]OCA98355.1 thiamine ABC transporter permease [Clostridium beijerinckii]